MIRTTRLHRLAVGCLVVLAVLALGPLSGVATSDYGMTADDETDTPTRTVEIEGSEYTISAVATARVGGSLTVSIDVPEDTSYALDVYDDEEKAVVNTHSGAGPREETIDLSDVEPGTYALALQVDGSVVAVKPLVVEGVSVSLDASIETGETLTATVDTTSLDGETTPASVEIAVWNGDTAERVQATETGAGTYEASLDGLAEGDYQVYAAAQGTGTVMDEPTVIGVSDRTWVTVTDGGDGTTGGTDGEETTNNTDGDATNETSDDGENNTSDDDNTSDGPQTPTEPDDEADSTPVVGPAAIVVPFALLIGTLVRRRFD